MANPTKRIIGERIPQVLAGLEDLQPCSSWELGRLLDMEPSNVDKYASRAVGMRLATVDRTGRPKIYRVVPGWRDLVAARNRADGVPEVVAGPVNGFYPLPACAVATPGLADLHPLYAVWR